MQYFMALLAAICVVVHLAHTIDVWRRVLVAIFVVAKFAAIGVALLVPIRPAYLHPPTDVAIGRRSSRVVVHGRV